MILHILSLTSFPFRSKANKLNSASLYKDGICSLIGTILAASLFANTLIIEAAPNLWWLDPVVAMICGVVAFGIGLHAVVVARWVQGLPILTLKWWVYSQGDGLDEIQGRALEPADFGENDLEMSNQEADSTKDGKPETKLSEVV